MIRGRKALHLVLVSLIFSSISLGEDWKKIAYETDEPGFGLRITDVVPDSQAEGLGLKPGDYVYQIDEQWIRSWGQKREGGEQLLIFVRKGGRKESAVVRPGKIGLFWHEEWRPGLDYLRGNIGVLDEKWDDAVVVALAGLRKEPSKTLNRWSEVKKLGYPDDELDAFVTAYATWQVKGENRVREAYEAVNEEFSMMPAVYFAGLEDMAMAANDIVVLQALHEADPATSLVDEEELEFWKEHWTDEIAEKRRTSQKNTLEEIVASHGEEITTKLLPGHPEPEGGRLHHDYLIKRRPHLARPGHWQRSYVLIPEGVRDVHCSINLRVLCFGAHPKYTTQARFGVFNLREEGDENEYPSDTLAELSVGRNAVADGFLSVKGGLTGTFRYDGDPGYSIPRKDVDPDAKLSRKLLPNDNSKMSEQVRLDIICRGNEILAFCRGKCVMRLPRPSDVGDMAIGLHVCGVGIKIPRFQVWTLSGE